MGFDGLSGALWKVVCRRQNEWCNRNLLDKTRRAVLWSRQPHYSVLVSLKQLLPIYPFIFFIMIHLIRVIKLIRRRCWSCVGCVTFASLLKVRLKCRLGTSPRVLLSRKDCNLFPRPPLHNDRTLAFIFHPSLSPLGGSLMYWRSLIPQE